MPELPEVQTIVNDLQILIGDTITGFFSDFKKAIKSDDFERKIVGKKIKTVERLGKNIIIELSDKNFIVAHLKMTGKLILAARPKSNIKRQEEKHLHHIFILQKNGTLEFHDIRKFATLELANASKITEIKNSKGIDPFSKDFTFQNFSKIIKNKENKSVKSFLMNQTAVSGIGNIYASEIPYDCRISPLRKINSLQKVEIKSLYKSILKILSLAIEMRGTSFSDYRDANGKRGGFQEYLTVYGKAGKKCQVCDTMIEKNVVEQRSTFHCPKCQK